MSTNLRPERYEGHHPHQMGEKGRKVLHRDAADGRQQEADIFLLPATLAELCILRLVLCGRFSQNGLHDLQQLLNDGGPTGRGLQKFGGFSGQGEPEDSQHDAYGAHFGIHQLVTVALHLWWQEDLISLIKITCYLFLIVQICLTFTEG